MNEFYEMKGIRREFSVVRTPQQNGVAKRKNRTLIEAAKTMLADSKLPTTFWDEAFNIACYDTLSIVKLLKRNHKDEVLLLMMEKKSTDVSKKRMEFSDQKKVTTKWVKRRMLEDQRRVRIQEEKESQRNEFESIVLDKNNGANGNSTIGKFTSLLLMLRSSYKKFLEDQSPVKAANSSKLKKASTLMKPNKTLIKDAKAEDVDGYLYRLMIGSLIFGAARQKLVTAEPKLSNCWVTSYCCFDYRWDNIG
ncbi:putative ribonuclease H-like domain-containing protein [Tanacetum coccineum]